ncbi:MAG: acid phosphatase type 7 [Thermacetogenium sp.]|jgi:hypothetical protein|nr:acid phosphatase type 7 [Thermacetogenium sp.]
MRSTASDVLIRIGKAIICLGILSLFLAFSPVMNPGLAAPGSCGSETGLPDQLILSWTEDPLTTQTISWRSRADGAARERVQYLPAADFGGSFDGAREVAGERCDLYDGHLRFKATLRGLNPGTSYVYRVGREGNWSEPALFTTAAAADRFSFLYMGDVQGGYGSWGEMLKRAAAENPGLKFALMGGDLVGEGNSREEWQQFLAASSPVFSRLPLMPAVGNHDDADLFRKYFAIPCNGPEGGEDLIYSFDYGSAHFVVLNSNKNADETVNRWLREDLRNTDKTWKFAVFHHPAYPVVDDYKGIDESIRRNWVPLLEQYGVDMVFVGHQHVYMRTRPLREGRIRPDGEGVVYVMGNAGTKYYGPGLDRDYMAKQVAWISNYQVIDIDGDTLTMTARDADGQVIDSYTIVKRRSGGAAGEAAAPPQEAASPNGAANEERNAGGGAGASGMEHCGEQVARLLEYFGMEAEASLCLRSGAPIGLDAPKMVLPVGMLAGLFFAFSPLM